MNHTLCAAPWIVHTVNANGTVGICCINPDILAKSHEELAQHGLLDTVKRDMLDGKPIQGCEKCYEYDAAGNKSLRAIYNGMHERYNNDFADSDILWFDLSMGNKCNQACRICGPHNSTGWLKDLSGFKDIYWAHVNNVITYRKHSDNSDKIPEIIRQMTATRKPFAVELKGGEPLYIDANIALLQQMIQQGLHEKCQELRIMTNGTAIDAKVMEMLRVFENINLAISIDAVGPLHSYTRGTRLTWDECRRCWQKLVNLPNVTELRISNTIYIYSVFHLRELYEFIRSEFGNAAVIADALLYKPMYLSVTTLPTNLRELAKQGLSHDHPVMALLNAPEDPDRVIRENRFRVFTKKLDKMRNERLADHIPQLAEFMQGDHANHVAEPKTDGTMSMWASYKKATGNA